MRINKRCECETSPSLGVEAGVERQGREPKTDGRASPGHIGTKAGRRVATMATAVSHQLELNCWKDGSNVQAARIQEAIVVNKEQLHINTSASPEARAQPAMKGRIGLAGHQDSHADVESALPRQMAKPRCLCKARGWDDTKPTRCGNNGN
jgi:hypothetical protein